ncbi:30S ribosomal protein S2 [Candidatus Gottesmanbacteria bacterium]|nr:30S ribosomal protein S2 [Candidatus Gottesmanbacteria bacterium]
MKDVSLKDLLEAGCHFGHRAEKWHPKAESFIYQSREGIHIIDLAKTREGLLKAGELIKSLGETGKVVLFVATKRQAKAAVKEAAIRADIAYLTNRWIGGFITNWDEVYKNIEKLNTMRADSKSGAWNDRPKHEIVKLHKEMRKLEMVYSGVTLLKKIPDAVFMVDIRRENSCLREAVRFHLPIVAIVDTNSDPTPVVYPIPANDDAVGSIQFIVNYLADSYLEGKKIFEKKGEKEENKSPVKEEKSEKVEEIKKPEAKKSTKTKTAK